MKKPKDPKEALRGALFAEAKKLGIGQEQLRNEIAPNVIGKRVSKASETELNRLIVHITGKPPRPSATPPILGGAGVIRFESSKEGLIQELESHATVRWGEDFSASLNKFANKFINRKSGVLTPYKMLRVASLVAVKDKIKELNRERG